MSWWNDLSVTKRLLVVLGILVGLSSLVVVVLMVIGPNIGCTLVGCSGGLNINLVGLPASSPFEISISSRQTGTQTLTCGSATPDETEEAFVKVCAADGAYFSLPPDSAPPDEVTVTVTVDGKKTSEIFHPDYQKFQPNGEGCPPVCYNATLIMNLAP